MQHRVRPAVLVGLLLAPLFAGCFDAEEGGGAGSTGASRGLVAASNPYAAEAGAAVLRAGGNAVDAAAAVQWALNVVEPPMSGLGGGAFLVFWLEAERRLVVLDGREVAPAAATPDQWLDATGRPMSWENASLSGLAVGVPGTVAVWDEALRRHGTWALGATMGEAVRLAEEGFRVNRFLAGNILSEEAKLASWPASAAVFLPGSTCAPTQVAFGVIGANVPRCTGGAPLAEGALLVQPDLAATFRLLAAQGLAAFYEGALAQAMAAAAAERDGRLSVDDLAGYRPLEREPLVRAYRGHAVATMPPPGGGLAVLETLGILEGFDVAGAGNDTTDGLHLLVEAMHLVYADRAAYLADPGYERVPADGLLHPEYLAGRRASIDPERTRTDVAAGDPWRYEVDGARPAPSRPGPEGGDTTHYVVVDAAGNVASVTTTIESAFGSGMVVPGYGFLLNNEMTDFDLVPGGANQVEPGKRPRSSMSPTIVFRGGDAAEAGAGRVPAGAEPWFTVGAPGGATIIASVTQALSNAIDHGMPAREAILASRLHSPAPTRVLWDRSLPPATVEGMEARGHEMVHATGRIGDLQAAMRIDEGWVGAADPIAREGTVVYVERVGHT